MIRRHRATRNIVIVKVTSRWTSACTVRYVAALIVTQQHVPLCIVTFIYGIQGKRCFSFEKLLPKGLCKKSLKGLVKKYRGGGGVGRSREGVGHDPGFEPCARGGLCNFQLPLGGGSPYFLLTTNETVDYTCYIKHSQLGLLLKYSQTCCARKYKG